MREYLKNELFRIALNRARANSFGFTSYLEKDLKEYINRSIDNISYTDYQSETKKLEARVNTLILVDAMTADGRSRELRNNLDFKSLDNIKSSICPLWPFC